MLVDQVEAQGSFIHPSTTENFSIIRTDTGEPGKPPEYCSLLYGPVLDTASLWGPHPLDISNVFSVKVTEKHDPRNFQSIPEGKGGSITHYSSYSINNVA